MKKPSIDYPCIWSYRVIGQDEQLLRTAVANAIGDMKHQLAMTNQSSGGKYRSLNLEVCLNSDQERLHIFEKLKNDLNVKFVL